jgi:hypothetical protein
MQEGDLRDMCAAAALCHAIESRDDDALVRALEATKWASDDVVLLPAVTTALECDNDVAMRRLERAFGAVAYARACLQCGRSE